MIEMGNNLYVMIDSHAQRTNYRVEIDRKYMGHKITIIESVNFILSSDVVSKVIASLIRFSFRNMGFAKSLIFL